MNKTKLVSDIGIYDAGRYQSRIANDLTPEYKAWAAMLQRCKPGGSIQRKRPTYIGCTVHPDFIKFQDFAEWCQTQIGFGNDGWAMDKDILIPGNKVYGPDTCVFVPLRLNQLLVIKRSNQGGLPSGVRKHSGGKYEASFSCNGTFTSLGLYRTPEDAYESYKLAKRVDIYRLADEWRDQIDPRVYRALMDYQFDSK